MSIDLVPLLAAEWTESDKHIKLIGLMTITMKKNNSDQTKGKPWTESVKGSITGQYNINAAHVTQIEKRPLLVLKLHEQAVPKTKCFPL